MKLNKKGDLGITAVIILVSAMLISLFVLAPEKQEEQQDNIITGAVVYNPLCDKNPNSCIDLNGDGMITYDDEDIFAKILLGEITELNNPKIYHMADFDNNSIVNNEIDFQQCFVSIRDYYIDYRSRVVRCNPPPISNLTNRTNHTGCTNGCADLNGDGRVNNYDFYIMTNSSVWNKYVNQTVYPMADLNGDGIIDVNDKDCMVPYYGKIVMCNLPVQSNHTAGCPDLTDEFGAGNDGYVNYTDKALFDTYYSAKNSKADLNGDGNVDLGDKYIFDSYYGKVVDCNIYHAPWHTGGIDQNNSNTDNNTTLIGGSYIASQSFITSREGQLTKIRFLMRYNSGNVSDINVAIYPDNGTGYPNASVLVPPKSKIPYFSDNETHWVTAYFSIPPVLTNNTRYHIVLSSSNSSPQAYGWYRNNDVIRGDALNSSNNGTTWANITGGDHVYEMFSSTACADFNGDGVVDQNDEDIINKIPDNITPSGSSGWNASFDLDLNHIIEQADADVIGDKNQGKFFAAEYCNGSGINNYRFNENYSLHQGFNASIPKLYYIDITLRKGLQEPSGSQTAGDIEVEIRASDVNGNISLDPNSLLAQQIIPRTNISTDASKVIVSFGQGINLQINKTYYIKVGSKSTNFEYYYWMASLGGGTDCYTKGSAGWNNYTDLLSPIAPDLLFTVYHGNSLEPFNQTLDVNNDSWIDITDRSLIEAAIPSYDPTWWIDLIDFNAVFQVYEKLRDKTLGFDAYKGKLLKCGLPTYTITCGNGRCEEGETFANCLKDCTACNYDSFCAKTENFTNCSDCELLMNMPIFSKFNGSATTNLYNISNLSNVYPLVLEITPYGKIEFLQPVDIRRLNFNDNINIYPNYVSINISALPQLNKSARISLYNTSFIYAFIDINGDKCPASVCTFISYDNSLVFNVTGFNATPITNYSLDELAPDISEFNGSTTNFSINSITNIENISSMVLEKQGKGKIIFLENINASKGNYTRDVEIDLNGGSIGGWVTVDTSTDNRLNKSARIYLYNLSLYNPIIYIGNSTTPSNETCNNSVCNIESYPRVPNNRICSHNCTLIFNVTHFTTYWALENTTGPQLIGHIDEIIIKENSQSSLNLDQYFFDINNDTFIYNYTVKNIPPSFYTVNITNGTAVILVRGWHGYDALISFNASDGINVPATTGDIPLTVLTNLPPQFSGQLNYTHYPWYEDQNVTIDLTQNFADTDGDNLTYDWTFVELGKNEENITVRINQSTGITSLSPKANWYNTESTKVYIVFNATDLQYGVTGTAKGLVVNSVNDPPYLIRTIQDIVQDEDTNVTINFTQYFTDVEDEFSRLNITLYNPSANFNFTYNSTTGIGIFIPRRDFYGNEQFIIKAADTQGGHNLSNTFNIYLRPIPDPLAYRANRTFNLTWKEDINLTINLSDYIYDPDNDWIIFSASNPTNYPNISIYNFNRYTGVLTLVPARDWFGTAWINFSAIDSTSSIWNYTLLNITPVNDPPVWNLTNFNISEDTSPPNNWIDLYNYSYDVDNITTQLNYTLVSQSNSSLINCSLISSRYINCSMPAQNQFGRNTLTLRVTDGQYNVSASTNITVLAVNDVPIVNLSQLNYMRLIEDTYNDTINLSNYIYDIDNTKAEINWSCLSNNTNVLALANNITKILNISSSNNYVGIVNLSCNATDTQNGTSIGSFLLNITPVNDPPYWISNITNLTWQEDTNTTLNLSQYFIEVDGQEINYSSTTPSNIAILINNTDKSATLVPDANFNGIRYIIFYATDGTFVTPSSNLTLNITSLNDAPSISHISSQELNINVQFSYQVSANDIDSGDSLSYFDNVTQFDINLSSGLITWTPNQTINFSTLITVCDNSNAANNCTNTSFMTRVYNYTNSTFVNSWVNGTNYHGSYYNISGIFGSTLNISNITGSIISVKSSYIYNSTIINSTVENCNISNSNLRDTTCKDASIDPSNIKNSDTTGSIIVNSYATNSNATYSLVRESTIDYSDVNNSNITNSTLYKTKATNTNITNWIIYSGILSYRNTTIYNATLSGQKNITDIVDYPPVAGFNSPNSATVSTSVSFTDTSTDKNLGGLNELNDSLTYSWDFGDSTTSNSTNPNHTYALTGTKTVILNVTDKFNESSAYSRNIDIQSAGGGAVGGGGGGGGGGGVKCTSSWQCTSWEECINGIQKRTCIDNNKCKTPATPMPNLNQPCKITAAATVCKEEWSCSSWSPSICPPEGMQTRACEDINKCGTESAKPALTQRCSYIPKEVPPSESCYDRIMNQGEEGVDCGGPCEPCYKPEETAALEKPKEEFNLIYLLLLILAVGLILVIYLERKNLFKAKASPKSQYKQKIEVYVKSRLNEGYNKKDIRDKLISEDVPMDIIIGVFKKIK